MKGADAMNDAERRTDGDVEEPVMADEEFEGAEDAASGLPEDPVAALEAQLAEAQAARMRALADFRNFQQRSLENERQAREDGRASVVRALLPALDNLELALLQDEQGAAASALVDGMRSIAAEFRRGFEGQGISVIKPEVGAPFDPAHHQAVFRQPTTDVEPGAILTVTQSGYVLGERVLRPANVVVGTDVSPDADAGAGGNGGGDAAGDTAGAEG